MRQRISDAKHDTADRKMNLQTGFRWTDGKDRDFQSFWLKTEEYYNQLVGGAGNRKAFMPYNISDSIPYVLIAYDALVTKLKFMNLIVSSLPSSKKQIFIQKFSYVFDGSPMNVISVVPLQISILLYLLLPSSSLLTTLFV